MYKGQISMCFKHKNKMSLLFKRKIEVIKYKIPADTLF